VSEPGPLGGVLVVELGNLIAAPYATMLLSDLGARVVKVEPPTGDLGRRFGPYVGDESAFFMAVNRGKESVALDMADFVSKRVLDNLVRKADVLVSNLRHGAMDRLGLGEDRSRELNPTLVYAVASAFGADGPYSKRAGVDIIFQGEVNPGSPVYRLTYTKTGSATLKLKFEIAAPEKPQVFVTYVEGLARRR